MSAVHFAIRGGILCATPGRWHTRSGVVADVTCRRCLKGFDQAVYDARTAVRAAQYRAETVAAAEAVGLADVLAFVETEDTPASRMVAGMLGSVAIWLHAEGYAPPQRLADTG